MKASPARKTRRRALDTLATAVNLSVTAPLASVGEIDKLLAGRRLSAGVRSDALKVRGVAQMELGDLAEAIESLEQALVYARKANDPQREAKCLNNRGIALAASGRVSEAMAAYSGALTLSGPRSPTAGIACVNLGLLAERIDERALAVEYALIAFKLLPAGITKTIAGMNVGLAMRRQEEWSIARPYIQSALQALSAGGQPGHRLSALASLIVVESLIGERKDARSALRELIDEAKSTGFGRIAMSAERSLLELLVRGNEIEAAVDVGERWLKSYRNHDELQRHDVEWWLAEAYLAMGDHQRALVLLRLWARWRQYLASDLDIAGVRKGLYLQLSGFDAPVLTSTGAAQEYVAIPAAGRRFGLLPLDVDLLCRMAQGATNTEIASSTQATLASVRNRISRILSKMEVKNRAGAVRLALELGIVRRHRA